MVGVAIAGVLYVTLPVQMTTYGAMGLNFLKSFAAPPGTLTTEANAAYKAPVAAVPSPPLAEAAWPDTAAGDWPSNRTPTSQRFSPLDQINAKNVASLKIQCVYEVGAITAFESGLIMVNNALIGSTEFDIFSINPATCAENWRTHLDYPPGLLPSNRGPAYMDGMLSRHAGLPGACLRFQDRQAGVGDNDLRPETRRVGAVVADRVGWPRLCRQCRW